MTAPTLLQLLDASRVFALRQAVVASLRTRLPCAVEAHPGRLDMEDVVGERKVFQTPSVNVGVIRVHPGEGRTSGLRDVPVEIGAYVVTTDMALGARGLVMRDELGLALCDEVLAILTDDQAAQWGLPEVGLPEQAVGTPLFTAKSNKEGTAFWAVTWTQVLYNVGRPWADLDAVAPADIDTTVLLPGDPGWEAP